MANHPPVSPVGGQVGHPGGHQVQDLPTTWYKLPVKASDRRQERLIHMLDQAGERCGLFGLQCRCSNHILENHGKRGIR